MNHIDADLIQFLSLAAAWAECPSVCRERKYFYYRRDANYIAWRIVQDRVSDRWFLHISLN